MPYIMYLYPRLLRCAVYKWYINNNIYRNHVDIIWILCSCRSRVPICYSIIIYYDLMCVFVCNYRFWMGGRGNTLCSRIPFRKKRKKVCRMFWCDAVRCMYIVIIYPYNIHCCRTTEHLSYCPGPIYNTDP